MADAKLKARANAKPALQSLKESGTSIFPHADNLPVPAAVNTDQVTKTSVAPVVKAKAAGTHAKRPLSDQTTVLTPPSADNEPAFLGAARKPKFKKQERVLSPAVILLLLIAVVALGLSPVGRSLFQSTPDPNLVTEQDRARWDQDARQHLDRTGKKLNRERVQVEYENDLTSNNVQTGRREKDADIMRGLPLAGEDPPRAQAHPKDEIQDLVYPDVRTQYTLDEEKTIREWESRADKRFVDEFIANAAKAGYAVKIGPDGVARVTGRVARKPSSDKIDDRFPEDAGPGRKGLSR